MKSLVIDQLEFDGMVSQSLRKVHEVLRPFSFEFLFGKIYLIDTDVGGGGWGLTSVIAGAAAQKSGEIYLNGDRLSQRERVRHVWRVARSQVRRFGIFGRQSTRWQISHGLRVRVVNEGNFSKLRSLDDYMQAFHLTLARLERPFTYRSDETWRASCAIGLANGYKIFCFPNMQFMRPDFDEEYYTSFFKQYVTVLRDEGSIILLPIRVNDANRYIGDEVVQV
jgi:energy-coupling factor transporter ATP-binding protein EcfA2